jgi:hypothetical protein
MSASPANTNDLDQVEPRFVVKVAVLGLGDPRGVRLRGPTDPMP